jgi:hypothetical protein
VFQSAPHVASTRDGFIDARDRRIELRVLAKGGHRSRTPRHVAHRDDEERGVSLSQVDVHLIIPDSVMFRLDRSQPLADWPREGERKLIRRALAGVGHRPETSLAGGRVRVHPGKRGG